jgi:hypothetical protein
MVFGLCVLFRFSVDDDGRRKLRPIPSFVGVCVCGHLSMKVCSDDIDILRMFGSRSGVNPMALDVSYTIETGGRNETNVYATSGRQAHAMGCHQCHLLLPPSSYPFWKSCTKKTKVDERWGAPTTRRLCGVTQEAYSLPGCFSCRLAWLGSVFSAMLETHCI